MTNFAYVAIKLCLACSLQDINVNGTDSLRKREILIGDSEFEVCRQVVA